MTHAVVNLVELHGRLRKAARVMVSMGQETWASFVSTALVKRRPEVGARAREGSFGGRKAWHASHHTHTPCFSHVVIMLQPNDIRPILTQTNLALMLF